MCCLTLLMAFCWSPTLAIAENGHENSYSSHYIILLLLLSPKDSTLTHTRTMNILCPIEGRYNNEYTYITSAIDQDDDSLYYMWDWGDETNSSWLGPNPSGDTVSVTHAWLEQGTYDIRVKTKDIYNQESPWSDPLRVTMPKDHHILFSWIERLTKQYPLLHQIFTSNYV